MYRSWLEESVTSRPTQRALSNSWPQIHSFLLIFPHFFSTALVGRHDQHQQLLVGYKAFQSGISILNYESAIDFLKLNGFQKFGFLQVMLNTEFPVTYRIKRYHELRLYFSVTYEFLGNHHWCAIDGQQFLIEFSDRKFHNLRGV